MLYPFRFHFLQINIAYSMNNDFSNWFKTKVRNTNTTTISQHKNLDSYHPLQQQLLIFFLWRASFSSLLLHTLSPLLPVCTQKFQPSQPKLPGATWPVLTWNINCLEAPDVIRSQLVNGADPWGRQHFLQEVCGAQAPHQGGELALGGRRADVGVHCADHGGVGRARATGAAVDVVKLWGNKTKASLWGSKGTVTRPEILSKIVLQGRGGTKWLLCNGGYSDTVLN